LFVAAAVIPTVVVVVVVVITITIIITAINFVGVVDKTT
jgi:hypothetical protein